MWDGFNKRKFPRVNTRCDIKITSDGETLSAVTENLGLGGVCVLLERELKRFQECQISLVLGKSEPRLKCEGRAVWIVPVREVKARKNQYDTGIEFLNVETSDTKRLQTYLADTETT